MDLVLFETPDSDYGDYMIKQKGEKGEKMPILGNGKYFAPKDKKKSRPAPEDPGDDNGHKKDPW